MAITYQQFIAKMDARIASLQSGVIMERAVRSVMAEAVVRIFEEGKNSSGGKIGSYNATKELYVNPNTLPRNVAPRGKPGKEKNVQSRKTVYFKSYKDLRSEVGRESGFVNIRLTNDLQSDYANAQVSGSTIATPEPLKISNTEYRITLKRTINQKKRAGLEAKYGNIFFLTQGEKERYFDVLRKEVALA